MNANEKEIVADYETKIVAINRTLQSMSATVKVNFKITTLGSELDLAIFQNEDYETSQIIYRCLTDLRNRYHTKINQIIHA